MRAFALPRRLGRRLKLVTGAVLALALVAVPLAAALHHHDDSASHSCAVCAAGHAPALPSASAPAPLPAERLAGRIAAPATRPLPARHATHVATRAPPRG